jgi:hypothetical protein
MCVSPAYRKSLDFRFETGICRMKVTQNCEKGSHLCDRAAEVEVPFAPAVFDWFNVNQNRC